MKVSKATSVEDYKIVSSFQSLRRTLLQDKFADRLEKPLAYWALPNDRRLPLAFLGRTLKDLLATPFDELAATPGIGQKKISSLVKLLSRATKDSAPAIPFGITELSDKKPATDKTRRNGTKFDPTIVSEALWAQWRAGIERHGLGRHKHGALAPSLQALPTVIWHTSLDNYVYYTLAEIRQLRTHGEKRDRVILEVFYLVNDLLVDTPVHEHFAVRLAPRFVDPLERWMTRAIAAPALAALPEVRDGLTIPLLKQLKIDGGDVVHELSEARLGVNGPPQSVRQQSKRMDLTRARVYQLLEECCRIMEVRWPEGQSLANRLLAKIDLQARERDDVRLLRATLELFFPGKKQLSDENPEE